MYMTIGSNIRKARKAAGLTQIELGERCGWDEAQTRISKYENDEREPNFEDLKTIAKATTTPLPLLFVDDQDSGQISRILNFLLATNSTQREGILAFLEKTIGHQNSR
jgi:transcriptional regulator with XRE-family HTH domain